MDGGGRFVYALNGDHRNGFSASMASVLPRLYRRFRRTVFQLVLTDLQVPRFLGTFAIVGFMSTVVAYGVAAGGHTDEVVKNATSTLGFAVENVEIAGNKRMSELDVLAALGLDGQTSMIGFNAEKSREVLAALPWVEAVNVQKVYPNDVRISIKERSPFAVWQHDGQMDIVDRSGRVIVPFRPNLVNDVPFIVGQGAQAKAADFIKELGIYPSLVQQIRSYIRVGDRRWDLLLNNGVRIKLPELNAVKRLGDVIKADNAQHLLTRDVLSVDLRLADRMTVALSDEAMERRGQVIKEEERLLKTRKAGRA